MASLKIGTLNVGGIHSPIKRKKILLYLKKMQIDIAYLQETHLLAPEAEKLGTLGWKLLASAPFSTKARGVVTLIRNSCDFTVHSTKIDPQGRYVLVDVTVDHIRLILGNIYAPNVYSKEYFLQVIAELYQFGDMPMILAGDFNIVASPKLDRSSAGTTCTRKPKVGIPYFIKHLHLMDIWRVLHPLDRYYTCLSAAHGSLSRIDHILTSDSLFPRILETEIEPICVSDHALCWLRVARSMERGPHRQWRFPSHLSQSVEFRAALRAAWVSYAADNVEHADNNPLMFWQASKSVLRGNILSFNAHRNKQLHNSFAEMQANLTSAYIKFKDSPSAARRETYQTCKTAFDALLSPNGVKIYIYVES